MEGIAHLLLGRVKMGTATVEVSLTICYKPKRVIITEHRSNSMSGQCVNVIHGEYLTKQQVQNRLLKISYHVL